VGGEDRANIEAEHRALDCLGARAKVAELSHRPPGGRGLRIGDALPQIRVAAPDAVRLLGGVDQQEKEGEGAGRHGAVRDAESVDLFQQVVEGRSVGIAVPTGAGCHAQPLDDRERLVTLEASDYATKRASQPANVIVEGKIFFSWGSRRWHGVKILQLRRQLP
jgi:hypothetical protein